MRENLKEKKTRINMYSNKPNLKNSVALLNGNEVKFESFRVTVHRFFTFTLVSF